MEPKEETNNKKKPYEKPEIVNTITFEDIVKSYVLLLSINNPGLLNKNISIYNLIFLVTIIHLLSHKYFKLNILKILYFPPYIAPSLPSHYFS